jgi:hypothetical protein
LDRIPPGTLIGEQAPDGWTHLISIAKPRLGSGDVDALPSMAAELAETFSLVILARVGKDDDNTFMLEKVALGNAMEIAGNMTVVNSQSQDELGANLGFLGKRVLKSSEDMLAEVRMVARYRNLVVFDTPALLLVGDRHRSLWIRNVVWISPENGALGSVLWAMQGNSNIGYSLVPDKKYIVQLPANLREDRVLNVDKDHITFGIPSMDAIAMAELPPGTKYPFPPSFEQIATINDFTPENMQSFAAELSNALRGTPL